MPGRINTFWGMIFWFILSVFLHAFQSGPPAAGISCRFKQLPLTLTTGMRKGSQGFAQRGGLSNADLDTLSNWFNPAKKYVEIIRQDDPVHPRFGIALGFEFDEGNGDYPYTPAYAKIQVKDFEWGGVEFSRLDTFIYTGVSNNVSDDLSIEVDGYQNDTIFGRFSGLLLSGAGPMAPIDSGYFRALVYRVQ